MIDSSGRGARLRNLLLPRRGRQPVARLQIFGQARLGRARRWRVGVFEAHPRRQRHQDRFGAAAGLQAEQRAAIVDQVELDVAAAAVELEFALGFAKLYIFPFFHNRQVRVEETVADRALEREAALEAAGVEVVEEQAADAARLAAVAQIEVFVAPALAARIDVGAERRAQRARHAVPVHDVLVERIVRGEVEAAAEPPYRLAVGGAGLEVAHVEMRGRHVGIARMQHQRHAERGPGAVGELRTRRAGCRRQARAVHVREIHPALLEHAALLQHARAPAAAVRALPQILDEARAAVGGFQRRAQAVLQRGEVGRHRLDPGLRHARGPQAWSDRGIVTQTALRRGGGKPILPRPALPAAAVPSPFSPLAITACTVTCAAGRGVEAFADALAMRKSGLVENDLGPEPLPCWIGRVPGLETAPLPAAWAEWESRNHRLAWLGLNQDGFRERAQAALARYGAARVALVLGTSTSSIGETEAAYRERDAAGRLPAAQCGRPVHQPHALGAFVQQALGVRGPALTIATACSSSAKVFASAARLLHADLADAAIVGGVDTLCGSVLYASPRSSWFRPSRAGRSTSRAAGCRSARPPASPCSSACRSRRPRRAWWATANPPTPTTCRRRIRRGSAPSARSTTHWRARSSRRRRSTISICTALPAGTTTRSRPRSSRAAFRRPRWRVRPRAGPGTRSAPPASSRRWRR